jgi:hypothetical protein
MKNIYLLLAILPFLPTACNKDDDKLFPETASERIDTRLRDNREVLQSAENGWIMSYYPSETQQYGGYTLFVKFGEADSVTVASELKTLSQPETITTLYALLPGSGPVLSFNTNNPFIHYFSEPRNPNGPVEVGMGGDYEFIVMDANPNEVVLRGTKTGNKIVLAPIDYGESWNTLMKQYVTASRNMEFLQGDYHPNGMNVIVQKTAYRSLNFYYTQGSANLVITIPFHYTPVGLQFYKPLKLGGVEVTEMIYVDDPQHPYFLDAGDSDTRLTITMR